MTAVEATTTPVFPTLEVAGKTFVCKTDKLPFGTLLKYSEADLDLLAIRQVLVKLFTDEDLEAIFDAFDEVGLQDASTAIQTTMGVFAERPTKRPKSS